MPRVVQRYFPDPSIEWETFPANPELHRTCTGDFAQPALDLELRRFLLRDVVGFVCLCAAALNNLFLTAGSFSSDATVDAATVGTRTLSCVAAAVGALLIGLALFCMSNRRPRTTALHLAVIAVSSVFGSVIYVLTPITRVTGCGDVAAIEEPLPANATWNDTAVMAREAAIADRQRYCVDIIDPWLLNVSIAMVCMLRPYSQHGVPSLIASVVAFGIAYAFRPSPTDANPYDVRPFVVSSDIVMQVAFITAFVCFNVRFHATSRARFVATARAEGGRRRAIKEMAAVDALLQRALPPAVLQRMVASGSRIQDVAERAAVAIAGVTGFGKWARAHGDADAVQALHVLAAALDDLVRTAGQPMGIEKIRAAGDGYSVVAGLPEAVTCYASVACRFGRRMLQTARRLNPEDMPGDGDGPAPEHSDDDADACATTASGTPGHHKGWATGALKLRVGVHCGPAFGSVLGTQRLGYEVYGDAYDGAETAVANGPAGQLCVTDAVRRRLAEEASLHAGAVDNVSLFASADEVATGLEQLLDVNAAATVVYRVREDTDSVEGLAGVASSLLSRGAAARADADRASVRTHSVVNALIRGHYGSDVSLWTAGKMQAQRAELERKLAFVLERATSLQRHNSNVRRGVASVSRRIDLTAPPDAATPAAAAAAAAPARDDDDASSTKPTREAMRQHDTAATPAGPSEQAPAAQLVPEPQGVVSDGDNTEVATTVGGSTTEIHLPTAADAEATRQLNHLEDSETGPFRRATRAPLVYAFADPEEESAYIEYARRETHELRRDVRIATVLIIVVSLAAYVLTASTRNDITVFFLVCAAISSVVNASLLVVKRGLKADVAVANVTIALLLVGVLVSTTHDNVLGNNPSWIYLAQSGLVDMPCWTLSPLVRMLINAVFAIAATAPIVLVAKGEYLQNGINAIVGIIALGLLKALHEQLNRQAFIETRRVDALAAQQHAARAARQAMLRGVVPTHVITPLRRWLASTAAHQQQQQPATADAMTKVPFCDAHDEVVVLTIEVRPVKAFGAGIEHMMMGVSNAAMIEAHATIDALLERCAYLSKVRTAGRRVVLAGPFQPPPRSVSTFAGDVAASGASAAVADAVFILGALQKLGVNVAAGIAAGPVVGAVVGTERLCYDVFGTTVSAAQCICDDQVRKERSAVRIVSCSDEPGAADKPIFFAGLSVEAVELLRQRPGGASHGDSSVEESPTAPANSVSSTGNELRIRVLRVALSDATSSERSRTRQAGLLPTTQRLAAALSAMPAPLSADDAAPGERVHAHAVVDIAAEDLR